MPDTNRRRRSGAVYLVGAVVIGALIALGQLPEPMWWTAVAVIGVVGVYHLVAGWTLAVRDREALEAANRAVPFAVGHASASRGFSGWGAPPGRDRGRLLAYSARAVRRTDDGSRVLARATRTGQRTQGRGSVE